MINYEEGCSVHLSRPRGGGYIVGNKSTRKKRVSERKRVKCIERRAKKGEREVGAEGGERTRERARFSTFKWEPQVAALCSTCQLPLRRGELDHRVPRDPPVSYSLFQLPDWLCTPSHLWPRARSLALLLRPLTSFSRFFFIVFIARACEEARLIIARTRRTRALARASSVAIKNNRKRKDGTHVLLVRIAFSFSYRSLRFEQYYKVKLKRW